MKVLKSDLRAILYFPFVGVFRFLTLFLMAKCRHMYKQTYKYTINEGSINNTLDIYPETTSLTILGQFWPIFRRF